MTSNPFSPQMYVTPSRKSRRKRFSGPIPSAGGALAMWVSWWRMVRSKQAAVKKHSALKANSGVTVPNRS